MTTDLYGLAQAAQTALDAHRALRGGKRIPAHAQMSKAFAHQKAQEALDALLPVLLAAVPGFLGLGQRPSLRVDGVGATVRLSWGPDRDRSRTVWWQSKRFVALVGAVDALARAPLPNAKEPWITESDGPTPFAFFGPKVTHLVFAGHSVGQLAERRSMHTSHHVVGQGRCPWDALRWLTLTRLVLGKPHEGEPWVDAQRTWEEGAAWALSLLPNSMPLWSDIPARVHQLAHLNGLDTKDLVHTLCSAVCDMHTTKGLAGYEQAMRMGENALRRVQMESNPAIAVQMANAIPIFVLGLRADLHADGVRTTLPA